MASFNFYVPSLGNQYIDYRDPIPGDSYNWSFIRSLNDVRYIAIHHTAAPATQTPEQIALYHINTNGWGGIGYHFLIAQDGRTYYVGDITTGRANVLDHNDLVIGVCLIGNFTNRNVPTDAQLRSAHELCAQLLFRTPELPNLNGWEDVVPHKFFGGTICPGDTWDQWQGKIVNSIEDIPVEDQERVSQITNLYRVVFGREPDQTGLLAWVQSNLPIDEVRKRMVESPEHKQLLNQAKNFKQSQALAAEAKNILLQAENKLIEIERFGS